MKEQDAAHSFTEWTYEKDIHGTAYAFYRRNDFEFKAAITNPESLASQLNELTRLRSELQQKDEWISVKDSLPNDEQMVLMYHDQQYFIGWLQIVYSDGYAVFKETNGLYNIPATHWKSLDPPKSKAK